MKGEGAAQMSTLLNKSYLVKVSTKGGQKCPKFCLRGLYTVPNRTAQFAMAIFVGDASLLHLPPKLSVTFKFTTTGTEFGICTYVMISNFSLNLISIGNRPIM